MKKKGIMEGVQAFIATCPHLKDFPGTNAKRVTLDKMDEEASAYMIESIPAEPVIKTYLDGSSVRRAVFALDSREYYEEVENIDTNNFYEEFSDWLEKCFLDGIFPDLGANREVTGIKAITPGYLYDAEGTKAKYRIQCELKYYQKKGE